ISDYIMEEVFSPFRADKADMQRVFESGMLEVQRELRVKNNSLQRLPMRTAVEGPSAPSRRHPAKLSNPT
ncbi:MAG: hypothetical protein WBN64_11845, partial [Candidatus Deferrimicrobium sp.]